MPASPSRLSAAAWLRMAQAPIRDFACVATSKPESKFFSSCGVNKRLSLLQSRDLTDPCPLIPVPGYFPITSIATGIVFGGMQALLLHAW